MDGLAVNLDDESCQRQALARTSDTSALIDLELGAVNRADEVFPGPDFVTGIVERQVPVRASVEEGAEPGDPDQQRAERTTPVREYEWLDGRTVAVQLSDECSTHHRGVDRQWAQRAVGVTSGGGRYYSPTATRPCQRAPEHEPCVERKPPYAHPTATIDDGAQIGAGTRIWHYCHISSNASIGEDCSFGQNCFVASGVVIGSNVKVQNNVSIYTGTEIEDDVFLGPSCVLTNVVNPRSHVSRRDQYAPTILRRGATVGANATIVCGTEIGRFAFIGAGSVVIRDVRPFAQMVGNPARQVGWRCQCGEKLVAPDSDGGCLCEPCGALYSEREGNLRWMNEET